MYYRLNAFSLDEMLICGADIRQFGRDSVCVEEAAEKIVRYLYRSFVTGDSERAFSLVRLYKTLRFDELDDELKRYAMSNFTNFQGARFLALMASAGQMAAWNDRRNNKAHRLLAISDRESLNTKLPMISQLLSQLEIEPESCEYSQAARYLMEPTQRRFNVFYIPEASTCEIIHDQAMMRDFGVRTILGFGGMLNRSSAFCVEMFANVFVPKECAELFNPLTLSTKNALIYATDFLPLVGRREPA
jgi:hypothetical protein